MFTMKNLARKGLSISCEVVLKEMQQDLISQIKLNIDSCHGLIPSGNKQLPETKLIQFYEATILNLPSSL